MTNLELGQLERDVNLFKKPFSFLQDRASIQTNDDESLQQVVNRFVESQSELLMTRLQASSVSHGFVEEHEASRGELEQAKSELELIKRQNL